MRERQKRGDKEIERNKERESVCVRLRAEAVRRVLGIDAERARDAFDITVCVRGCVWKRVCERVSERERESVCMRV